MLRCFHKAGYKHNGFRISAYGGMELLELIMLLSEGVIYGDIDLEDKETRRNIIKERISLRLRLKCRKCGTNCTG